MSKLTTTLAELRKHGACTSGYNRLVRSLQGLPFTDADEGRDTLIRFNHKEPISLLYILGSNGVDDCLWALRAAAEPNRDYLARMIAADCAESVLHLFTAVRPNDDRPRLAIDATRAFARGEVSEDDQAAAGAAARDAARDAARAAAWDAAGAAARAAARAAAWDAAGAAARAAAWDAAGAAAGAAARAAARAAAWDAAWDAEREKQATIIRAWLA
jgi:hypothetical protein